MSARSFTLTDTGNRPLTVNAVAGLHRQRWATHTRAVRERWGWITRAAKVPHLAAVEIAVTPLHSSGRSPQDVAACVPEFKAALDGIVDAGVLDDDGPRFVRAVTFFPARVGNADGIELILLEVPCCSS